MFLEANYSDTLVSSWLAHFEHEAPSTDAASLSTELVEEPAAPTESVSPELWHWHLCEPEPLWDDGK